MLTRGRCQRAVRPIGIARIVTQCLRFCRPIGTVLDHVDHVVQRVRHLEMVLGILAGELRRARQVIGFLVQHSHIVGELLAGERFLWLPANDRAFVVAQRPSDR